MDAKSQKLVNIRGLSAELGLPIRSLRTLMHERKFSFIKCGHRTCLFDPQKVRSDLERFEIKAVTAGAPQ
jgi:hypothetical protein